MKKSIKSLSSLLAALALTVGVPFVYAHTNTPNPSLNAETEEVCPDENKAFPGMFFTSESVVEEYEYDGGFTLLYDDSDAGMPNVEITVDARTYYSVIDAIKEGKTLTGTLEINPVCSSSDSEVYTFVPEGEIAVQYQERHLQMYALPF